MIVRIRLKTARKDASFVHPMNPSPRTAVLAPGFQASKATRVFPQGWDERAVRFQPKSIAAPVEELRRLADQGVRVEHSVIVLSREGDVGLSSADRERFWRVFGVPIYEQYLDSHNELLAMECDAHAGMHVLRGCDNLRLEREACACGNKSPRLRLSPRVDELVELLA